MIDKFTVFDVETPNSFNNRMSSIGVCVIEQGKITSEFSTLIDPETDFDYFNSRLTGIYPEDVAFSPAFDEIFSEIRPMFENSVLCAHNAIFDLGVLSKCLNSYCVDFDEKVGYLCTYQIGRKFFKDLENRRLNTISDHLGIKLSHHDALSDARACALILLHYINNGVDPEDYIKFFDLTKGRVVK